MHSAESVYSVLQYMGRVAYGIGHLHPVPELACVCVVCHYFQQQTEVLLAKLAF